MEISQAEVGVGETYFHLMINIEISSTKLQQI